MLTLLQHGAQGGSVETPGLGYWTLELQTLRLHTVRTTFLSNITSDGAAGVQTAAATLLLHPQYSLVPGLGRGW